MRTGHRLALASLLAAALLCGVLASASANKLSISQRAFRITWAPMEVGLQPEPHNPERSFIKDSCNVTMEGSFHSSTFNKVVSSLIGFVTRVAVDSGTCVEANGNGGTFTFLPETLPWHIRYASFSGFLPNITSVQISFIGMAVRVTNPFQVCLSASTVTEPAGWRIIREAGGAVSMLADERIIMPLPTGIGCELWLVFYQGRGRVTRLGTTESIRLSLI